MAVKLFPVPAPTGGWNAKDALADMSPTDAVVLENWYPSEGKVINRKGSTSFSTNGSMTNAVDTLVVLDTGAAQKLIGASDGRLWDVSASSAISLGTGFTNNRWQAENFDGKMGLVNGQDAPQTYDGTTLAAMTISGMTATTLIGIRVFKGRTFFWADNTLDYWYSAINTLGGACTKFPLSRVAGLGGKLLTIERWGRDTSGAGPADLWVAITSSAQGGQVIIYSGLDPGSDFSLVGIYKIATPLSRRCALNYSNDLLIATVDGIVSLQQVVMGNPVPTISDKIRNAIATAAGSNSSLFGWQLAHFVGANMMLLNVARAATSFDQYVMNLATKAWCKFSGWNGGAFCVFQGTLYFGTVGAVYKAWTGQDDNGSSVQLDAVPAFNYFKSPNRKRVTAVQLFFSASANLTLSSSVEKDFVVGPRPSVGLSVGVSGTPWGSAWGSAWGSVMTQFRPWKAVAGEGRALTHRVAPQVKTLDIEWYATSYAVDTGGEL